MNFCIVGSVIRAVGLGALPGWLTLLVGNGGGRRKSGGSLGLDFWVNGKRGETGLSS